MADQLSALDLDAELREAQDNGYTPTAQMIVYLIQRLREAEGLAQSRWIEIERETKEIRRLEKRLRETEADLAKTSVEWFAEANRQRNRADQLERVREAAQAIAIFGDLPADISWTKARLENLRAALDAMLRLTEDPTAHKAGNDA